MRRRRYGSWMKLEQSEQAQWILSTAGVVSFFLAQFFLLIFALTDFYRYLLSSGR